MLLCKRVDLTSSVNRENGRTRAVQRIVTQSAITVSKGIPYSLVTTLAAAGAAETAYLSWVKLAGGPLLCPTTGCFSVLSSPYAQLFDIPLPLLGLATYGAVTALSAAAAAARRQGRDADADTLDIGLTAGVAALAGCSLALMTLLVTRLDSEACLWCLASAGLSFGAAALVGTGLAGSGRAESHLVPGGGLVAASAFALYFGLGGFDSSKAAAELVLPYESPAVNSSSSPRAIKLAKRLSASGAQMFGAFWCSHCLEQKVEFGKEAMASFPYVECFPNGWKQGEKIAAACSDAGVRAFPTWLINGNKIEGELTLNEVEDLLNGKKTVAQISGSE